MDVADLIRDADQALADRDFGAAASLLEQAASLSPGDMDLWMRVAAVRRGIAGVARTGDALAGCADALLAAAPPAGWRWWWCAASTP